LNDLKSRQLVNKGLKPEDPDMQDGKVIVKADPGKGLRWRRLFRPICSRHTLATVRKNKAPEK
jgi:hypothetical protein